MACRLYRGTSLYHVDCVAGVHSSFAFVIYLAVFSSVHTDHPVIPLFSLEDVLSHDQKKIAAVVILVLVVKGKG